MCVCYFVVFGKGVYMDDFWVFYIVDGFGVFGGEFDICFI